MAINPSEVVVDAARRPEPTRTSTPRIDPGEVSVNVANPAEVQVDTYAQRAAKAIQATPGLDKPGQMALMEREQAKDIGPLITSAYGEQVNQNLSVPQRALEYGVAGLTSAANAGLAPFRALANGTVNTIVGGFQKSIGELSGQNTAEDPLYAYQPPSTGNTIAAGIGGALPMAATGMAGGGIKAMAGLGGVAGVGSAREAGADWGTAAQPGAVGAITGAAQGTLLGQVGRLTSGIQSPLLRGVAAVGGEVGGNAAFGAGGQIAGNMIDGRPALENVGHAALEGGAAGLAFAPLGVHHANAAHGAAVAGHIGDVTGAPGVSIATPPQGRAALAAKYIGDAVGRKVVWFDSDSPVQAFPDTDGKTIYANARSPQSALPAILAHEAIGHVAKDPAVAGELDGLRQQYPGAQAAAEQEYLADLEAGGFGGKAEALRSNPALLREEGTAKFIEEAIKGNPELVEDIAGRYPGLFARIGRSVGETMDRLSGGNKAKARMVREQLGLVGDVFAGAEQAGRVMGGRQVAREEAQLDRLDPQLTDAARADRRAVEMENRHVAGMPAAEPEPPHRHYTHDELRGLPDERLARVAAENGVTVDARSTTVPRILDAQQRRHLAGMSDKELWDTVRGQGLRAGTRQQNIDTLMGDDRLSKPAQNDGSVVESKPATKALEPQATGKPTPIIPENITPAPPTASERTPEPPATTPPAEATPPAAAGAGAKPPEMIPNPIPNLDRATPAPVSRPDALEQAREKAALTGGSSSATETKSGAEQLTAPKRQFTNLPREWMDRQLNSWHGGDVGVEKGKRLPTGNGKTGRYMTQAMLHQLERVHKDSKSLTAELRSMTDEVWAVKGKPSGYTLAPREAVAEATQRLKARGIDPEREALEAGRKRDESRQKWRASQADRERKIGGVADELRREYVTATGRYERGGQTEAADPKNQTTLAEALAWAKDQPKDSRGYLLGYLHGKAKGDPRGTTYQWVDPTAFEPGTEINIGKETLIVDMDPDTGEVMLHDGVTIKLDENADNRIPARSVTLPAEPESTDVPYTDTKGAAAAVKPAARLNYPDLRTLMTRHDVDPSGLKAWVMTELNKQPGLSTSELRERYAAAKRKVPSGFSGDLRSAMSALKESGAVNFEHDAQGEPRYSLSTEPKPATKFYEPEVRPVDESSTMFGGFSPLKNTGAQGKMAYETDPAKIRIKRQEESAAEARTRKANEGDPTQGAIFAGAEIPDLQKTGKVDPVVGAETVKGGRTSIEVSAGNSKLTVEQERPGGKTWRVVEKGQTIGEVSRATRKTLGGGFNRDEAIAEASKMLGKSKPPPPRPTAEPQSMIDLPDDDIPFSVKGREEEQAAGELLRVATEKPASGPPVRVGTLSQSHADILARLGVAVPAGTRHEAQVEVIRHVMNGHPELTPRDIARIPQVINDPTWIGATDTGGYKRVWFVKQNGGDKLYLAVYGAQKRRLVMKTYYTDNAEKILADLKNKGVPLEAVAKSAVTPDSLESGPDHPGSQPGLIGSGGTPENTIDRPAPPVKENLDDARFSIAPRNEGDDQPPARPALRAAVSAVRSTARDVSRYLSIHPVPRLTEAGVGDAAVEHASAKIATPKIVDDLLAKVLPDSYQDEKATAGLADVLLKNRYLGAYDRFDKLATEFAAQAHQASPGRSDQLAVRAQEYRNRAAAIKQAHKLPEYNADVVAAMKNPDMKAAIERYQKHVSKWLDELYQEVKGASEEPAFRAPKQGRHFDAYLPIIGEIEGPDAARVQNADEFLPPNNTMNAKLRKDRFDRRADYTGTFDTDLHALLSAVVGPRWNEATKLRFYKSLIASGAAVEFGKDIDKPAELQGKPVASLDVKMPRYDPETGQTTHPDRKIFLRADLHREVRDALDTDQRSPQSPLAKALTTVQLFQLADAVTHAKNIASRVYMGQGAGSRLFDVVKANPAVGIPRTVAKMYQAWREVSADGPGIRAEISQMAKAGMIRARFDRVGLLDKIVDRTGWDWVKNLSTGDMLHGMDTAARVILNRQYSELVAQGRAEESLTSRRNFVNTVGQYNHRLMGPLMKSMRDAGISPFIVAGRTYNKNAVDVVAGNPGFTAPTKSAQRSARLTQLGMLASIAMTAPLVNMITTGTPGGRSGTPLGAIDLGGDDTDGDGNHKVWDVLQLAGVRRGLRATGLDALGEGLDQGKDANTIGGNAFMGAGQAALHPWLGPAVGFGFKALTGRQLDIRGKMDAATIPEGGAKQYLENLRAAVESQNPLVYALTRPAFQAAGLDQKPQDEESGYVSGILGTAAKSPLGAAGVKDVRRGKDSAEDLADRLAKLRYGNASMTPEDSAKFALRRHLTAGLKLDPAAGAAAIEQAVEDGKLSEQQAANIHKKAGASPFAWNVKSLSGVDAAKVYAAANDKEKDQIRELVLGKVIASKELSPQQQDTKLEELGIDPPADLALRRELHELGSKARAYAEARKKVDAGDHAARGDLQKNRLSDAEQDRLKRLQTISRALTKTKKEGGAGAASAIRQLVAAA